MPTYGYRCTNCGHEFEIFQRMADDPLKVCPNCSQATLKGILYPAGVVFKGSGFYTTDYKGSGSRSSGSNGSSSSSEGSSEKKADSKPETKSESKSDSSD